MIQWDGKVDGKVPDFNRNKDRKIVGKVTIL